MIQKLIYITKIIFKFILYYPCIFISKHIDYFHYKFLSRFLYPIFTINQSSGIIGNKCYGNLWAVKKAMGNKFDSRCMIEHGLYFGEFVLENECTIDSIDTIYTFSNYRKQAILKWFEGNIDKKIVPIGPYIQYVNNFKTKKRLVKLKNELGKVLLVFPSHSFIGAYTEYNINDFIQEIESMSKDYDTVLISLYYLDIIRGYDKIYIQRGYKIVCSGIRTDRWFLSRQKDLFCIADMSMSNDVGTHVGYSITMNVPHYIFKQPIEILGCDGIEYSKSTYNEIRHKEFNEIIKAFNIKENTITENQRNIVNYYWGQQLIYE